MKKARQKHSGAMRPEYDFGALSGGVRGKYAALVREGTNLVLLEEDVAATFPAAESVNEALRVVMKAAAALPRKRATRKPRGAKKSTKARKIHSPSER